MSCYKSLGFSHIMTKFTIVLPFLQQRSTISHSSSSNNNNNNINNNMSDSEEEEYLEQLEWRELKARWQRDLGLDAFDVGLVRSTFPQK